MIVEPPAEHAFEDVYSPPRVAPLSRKSGMPGGWSFDKLTCEEQGRPWDVTHLPCEPQLFDFYEVPDRGI